MLPDSRVVAFYGAPQMGRTILGLRSPTGATRALAQQAAPYAQLGDRPVVGEFDLVSVFATAGGGPDGQYRSRQSDEVIEIYLERARAMGARLMLDIEPGRSTFAAEVRHLRSWIAEPDVDISLDPEWNVGPRGVPGRTTGRVGHREINGVIRSLAKTVKADGLPPKLLVVHQFSHAMIRGRSKIKPRPGVQTVLTSTESARRARRRAATSRSRATRCSMASRSFTCATRSTSCRRCSSPAGVAPSRVWPRR